MEAVEIQKYLMNIDNDIYQSSSVSLNNHTKIIGVFGAFNTKNITKNSWKFTKIEDGIEEVELNGFDILKIELTPTNK